MEIENVIEIESPRVAFVTMGCAKNEVDTQRMQSQLQRCGFVIEQDPEVADAVVVNTCSFIQSATEESLEAIFEVAGMPNVAAGAALVACLPVTGRIWNPSFPKHRLSFRAARKTISSRSSRKRLTSISRNSSA